MLVLYTKGERGVYGSAELLSCLLS
uniref:Uncharacterized protein n=1 Tax=Rhizophora mucronata TaxID=61149 RepID=A0A2P2PU45_RHIMU